MALSLETINRELVSQFDASPFAPVVCGSYECVSWVRGRDGALRPVSFTMHDYVSKSPAQFIEHVDNLLTAASQAGATKPFCLHCGREY